MPTTFDDVLLDVRYSASADGGPEFATAIIRSGTGGAVSHRSENREDYISKYEIEFAQMNKARRKALREFGILRKGMARAFRFLAPDDAELENETVGVLDAGTGEIVKLVETDGSTKKFFIIKHYADAANDYIYWATKPSPADDLTITIADADAPATILAFGTATGLNTNPLAQNRNINLGSYGIATIYFRLGIITFPDNLPAGLILKVSGKYHVPAAFTSDWGRFSIDDGGTSGLKVQLEEMLPVEMGLNPSMSLPSAVFTDPPSIPQNLTLTPGAGSMTVEWDASIAGSSPVDHYELEISV